jgi:hypothetical protein
MDAQRLLYPPPLRVLVMPGACLSCTNDPVPPKGRRGGPAPARLRRLSLLLQDALKSSMRWRRSLRRVAPAVASIGLGCLASPSRGYPLYPSSDGARPDESRVAQLEGYVRYVDGANVSPHGESFEVQPGCHIVGTPSTWGDATMGNTAAVIVTTGKVTFALPMKPGYRYTVRVELGPSSGRNGTAAIEAYESDGRGTTTRTFGPTNGTVDPATCEQVNPAPSR